MTLPVRSASSRAPCRTERLGGPRNPQHLGGGGPLPEQFVGGATVLDLAWHRVFDRTQSRAAALSSTGNGLRQCVSEQNNLTMLRSRIERPDYEQGGLRSKSSRHARRLRDRPATIRNQ